MPRCARRAEDPGRAKPAETPLESENYRAAGQAEGRTTLPAMRPSSRKQSTLSAEKECSTLSRPNRRKAGSIDQLHVCPESSRWPCTTAHRPCIQTAFSLRENVKGHA